MTSQHGKPSSFAIRSGGAHRKIKAGRRLKPGRITVVLLGSLLAAAVAAQITTHGSWLPGQGAAFNHAARQGPAASRPPGTTASAPTTSASRPPSRHSPAPRPTPTATQATAAYANPLRAVRGLIPERIDMGVDFGGTGPVYALGDAVITNASGDDAGWPGGGWITYRLTSGPAKGLSVYLAEDVTPDVQVGDEVTSGTVIATMFNGGAGIEFGWAQADGSSAESQLAAAGDISGAGPFPSMVGLNFEELLQKLGVPAANNRDDSPHGLLPAGYPADWAH
jgi:murein DD-endopeptidase MepM/ murein hydrolase activator NlpD